VKALAVLALLLQAGGQTTGAADSHPSPHDFRLVRAIEVPPGDSPRACAALDGSVYAHASAGLADVRLFSGGVELPYALTLSDTPTASDELKVLNLGLRDHHIVFDLQMPARLYSRVNLDIDQHDFVAIAKVSGLNRPGETGTLVGTFDLFDFYADGLARNTSVALAESSFPYLHFEIIPLGKGHAARDINPLVVRGAVVPPSRQAQTIYTTVAETSNLQRQKRESVATFHLPPQLPVERIRFDVGDGGPRNFSRVVHVRAKAEGDAGAVQEDAGGTISRINMTQEGEKLHMESLTVPVTVGSNAVSPAYLEVGVDNGDDQPVDIRAVKLEMRERKICFDAPAGPVQMFYGDAKLPAPEYDYGRLFNTSEPARAAVLDAEAANPAYVAPADARTLMKRHPGVIWIVLVGVILVLGAVAFGSAKRV
jgi:hypothetical protein